MIRLEAQRCVNHAFLDGKNRHDHLDMISSDNIQLKGTPVSPGFASGHAFIFTRSLALAATRPTIGKMQMASEHGLMRRAFDEVIRDLSDTAENIKQTMDGSFAEIFNAQITMLKDPVLLSEIENKLHDEPLNAEEAVKSVFRRFELEMKNSENTLLRQRSDDVIDLAKRILNKLSGVGIHAFAQLPRNSILILKRLLPSDAVALSGNRVDGIVLEVGGPASHAAILAREMGIPAVSGIPDAMKRIFNDHRILVDGTSGNIVVNPCESQENEFKERKCFYNLTVRNARTVCMQKAYTGDGTQIPVMANIGDRNDSLFASQNGADGIGLYRIEQIYLSAKKMPDENELYEKIGETLLPLEGLPINIRLLDTGSDKKIPFLHYPYEPNPALGLRGIRFLLKYDTILETQLKAILRLSKKFNISILVPMVTHMEDMHTTRTALQRLADELQMDTLPKLGAMIETPAAALCINQIAEYADFFSLGTNDLTQYTLAAGRENHLVLNYYEESHPAVMKLLKMAIDNVTDRPIGICGELASHPEAIPLLLKAGIRMLSVAPFQIPFVKEKIRSIRLDR